MGFSWVISLPEKPIVYRYLCLWCMVALGPSAALCQPPTQALSGGVLTETEAVRLGLSRPEVMALREGEIGIAQSEVMAVQRWLNPEFSYTREPASSIPGDPDQDYFWLTQRLDLSGRRGLRTEAAERRVRAVTHENELRWIELEAEIRQRFYEILQRERRVGAVRQWAGRMKDIADIVRRLEAAGEVSTYDLQRLLRERGSAEARLEAEQAGLAQTRERLNALLGLQEPRAPEHRVEGTLLPPTPPAPLESQLAALAARPDLLGLEQRVAAVELEQKAATRWWLPEIALGAGIKQIAQGPFDDSVPLVSTAIALPLLDRQQPERSRADAQAQLARSQRSLLLAQAAGDVRGLWQQANRLSNAAHRFREKTAQLSPDLIRIAEAAYQGGQTGILELLDAYRSALETELQALDLELNARQAHIELDRLTGRSLVNTSVQEAW
jgi:cobalt-zinc-cadmium efflux system outer membrane protein